MRGSPAIALAFACVAAHAGEPAAPRVRFDATLLRHARDVDLSVFEAGDLVRTGLQDVEVWRNGELLGRRSVRFAGVDAQACVDADFVAWLGVRAARLDAIRERLARDPCSTMATLHPAASARHAPGDLALHLSIPQALLVSRNDAIDPASLDAGMTAFRLSYGIHLLRSEPRGTRAVDQGSLRLDAGFNAGAWRLRHRSTHLWRPAHERESDTLSAHIERDVPRFDAHLAVGDFHATGLLFDPVALRGLRFQSDGRMLPASQQRNAPMIRGVADTNARVQVHQAGRLLFDTTVPPGPFAFDDVQPLARGGDLDVRIVESDGRVRRSLVPYAAMPGLLRAGRKRFGLAAGRVAGADTWDAPVVAGALEAGLQDRATLRAAVHATSGHVQALAGVAVVSRVGAVSVDRMHSRTTRETHATRGAATRATFATDMAARATLQLSASHTPVSFTALQDLVHPLVPRRERQRLDATLHKAFSNRRQGLHLSFVDRRFHAFRGIQRSAQLGWSSPLGRDGAVLHAAIEYTRPIAHHATHNATLALTLPLRFNDGASFAHAHARAGPGRFDLQSGIGGALGEQRAWNLGFARADVGGGSTTTASGSLAHAGQAGRIDAGLSVSSAVRHASVTAEGGLLAHPHGITLGPMLGDTIALIRADHGAGARVLQAPKIRLDRRGQAIAPHLSPYRRNRVGIDVHGASTDVAFDWTERDVFPRAGAIIDLPLASAHRPMQFVRIVGADGQAVPFGARIVDAMGTTLAIVGRDGVARVPADNVAWFLEGHADPCDMTPAATDTTPVATCTPSTR